MLTFKFLHVDNTNVGFQLNKTVCDMTFIGNFERFSGRKGSKGIFFTLCFPRARVEISRVRRMRG